jgi:hypothetical protein
MQSAISRNIYGLRYCHTLNVVISAFPVKPRGDTWELSIKNLEMDLPLELPTGRARLAITITPEKKEIPANEKTAFGCLQRFADPSKIPGEKGAWQRAVVENYAAN